MIRLEIYPPDQQLVSFGLDETLDEVIQRSRQAKTMLAEYLRINPIDPSARTIRTSELPQHFIWNPPQEGMEVMPREREREFIGSKGSTLFVLQMQKGGFSDRC